MRSLILLVSLLFSFSVEARTFKWTEVNKLSLELKQIGEGKRDPYFDYERENWQYKLNLLWDVTLAERFFLHSDTYFDTSNSKVTHIGWHYRSGVHVFKWLDLVHEHHSRHSADQERPMRFPVEDSYGIRINFVEQKR